MAFKRIVAKSEEDLNNIQDDIITWFKETKDYKTDISKETKKFLDPETKNVTEKQIVVIKVKDGKNNKESIIKFIPMLKKEEMKIEIGGEGESVITGKINNQMKGRGTLKSYTKDNKTPLKENIMKKDKLRKLIKEEIIRILEEQKPEFNVEEVTWEDISPFVKEYTGVQLPKDPSAHSIIKNSKSFDSWKQDFLKRYQSGVIIKSDIDSFSFNVKRGSSPKWDEHSGDESKALDSYYKNKNYTGD